MKNAQISKTHFELIKKIYGGQATEKDIKSYVQELLKENIFDTKSLPILNFNHINSGLVSGSYSVKKRTIKVYGCAIENVMQNKNNIVELINTFGHEFGHHLQTLIIPATIEDEEEKQHGIWVQDIFDDIDYYNGKAKLSLELLSKKNSQKILGTFLSKNFANSATAKWYESLDQDAKDDLVESLEYSKYAQLHCEEDARDFGISYTSSIINIYLSDPRIKEDKELYDWITFLSKCTQSVNQENKKYFEDGTLVNLTQENKEIKACYCNYKNLKDAVEQEVNYTFLKKVAKKLVDSKDSKEKKVIDALLEVLVSEYVIKKIDESNIKKDIGLAADNLFDKNCSAENKIVSSKIIRNTLQECDKEFAEFAISKLLHIYTNHKNTHVFGKQDSYLLYFASTDYNCYYMVKRLVKSLYEENRIQELCELIDFNSICEYADERYDYNGDFYYCMDSFMKYKIGAINGLEKNSNNDTKFLISQTKKLLVEYDIREEICRRSLREDLDFQVEDEKNKKKILTEKMIDAWGVDKNLLQKNIDNLEKLSYNTNAVLE